MDETFRSGKSDWEVGFTVTKVTFLIYMA